MIKKPLKLTYERDGKIIETEALTLLVSNSKNFAGMNLYPNTSIGDGKFEVAIVKKFPFAKLYDFASKVSNYDEGKFSMEDYSDYVDYFQTDNFEVIVDTDKKSLNNDGDEVMMDSHRLRYDIKKKIKVMVPKVK